MTTDPERLVVKYRRLVQQAHDPSLTLDQKTDLLEEAEYLKGYVCHLRGYSDITVLDDTGQYLEDYFGHVPIEPLVDTDDMPKRRARRVRKEDIKHQLLMYYKYDNRMLKNKTNLYKRMWDTYFMMAKGFALYGVNSRFHYDGEMYTYITHKRLRQSIDAFSKEFIYIATARRMRSLYGSYLPSNFGGRHRIIVLSGDSMDWLYMEPALEMFREYIASDVGNMDYTWCGKGILTPNCLETILRIALRPGKFTIKRANRTDVYYNYSEAMKKYLPLPDDNTSFIENLRVQTLITRMRTEPSSADQERMLYGRYTEEEASDFLNEMEAVQHYADEVYEN